MTPRRAGGRLLRGLAIVLLSVAAACTSVPRPEPGPAPGEAADLRTPAEAAEAWRRVLEAHVDSQGRIDFQAIATDRADLDSFVRYVYAVSPSSHPSLFADDEAELAYLIDAYNALALHTLIDAGIPERVGGGLRLVGFFVLPHQRLGGERINLYGLERRRIIPTYREPRAHFALNCLVRDCPRLPRYPFTTTDLDAELDARAHEFLNDPDNVRIDAERRTVTLNEILRFYRAEFEEAAGGSLLAYVNRYRDRPVPDDVRIAFEPYDWRINAQTAE